MDQARLSGARYARDADEGSERERHIQVLQVVMVRVVYLDKFSVAFATRFRCDDALFAAQVFSRDGFGILDERLGLPFRDNLAAVLAGARTDLQKIVRRADRLFVVLYDDHGVADVAEFDESRNQSRIIALVESDARFIEHVEHALERGADLGGEPDALCFSTGERRGRSRERQVR